MKKITLFILFLTLAHWSYSQCTTITGDYYGGVVMLNDGSAEQISSDNWPNAEYSSVENLIIGNTYTVTGTNTTSIYITIAEIDWGAPALGGTILGHGASSVDFTATTTDVIIHWHLNALCETQASDATVTTIQCTSVSCTCTETSAPGAPTITSIANGATNVPIDMTDPANWVIGDFSWIDGSGTVNSTNLTLGTDLAGTNIGTINGMTNGGGIQYANLWEYSTTYYWSIESINCFGGTTSPVFSFTTESDPLSIEDQVLDTFSVHPNPVKDFLNIDTGLTIESIILTDLLGKQVLEIKGNSITKNRIDLSSQSNGLYLLQINALEKSQTFKVIKE